MPIASPVHAGQEFSRVGLANCAINTSQPVGTPMSISFLVFDRGTPVLNATAGRTLVIVSPCATGTTGDVDTMTIIVITLTCAQQSCAQLPVMLIIALAQGSTSAVGSATQ